MAQDPFGFGGWMTFSVQCKAETLIQTSSHKPRLLSQWGPIMAVVMGVAPAATPYSVNMGLT